MNRKTSIIRQVAIIFVLGIFLIGILTFLSVQYISARSVDEQTTAVADSVTNEVKQAVTEYPAHPFLLRYWYEHAREMELEYDATYEDGVKTELQCRIWYKNHPDMPLDYVTEEQIDDLKKKADDAFNSLVLTTSYEDAAADADLVIEAIAENPQEKIAFYTELQKHLPENTVLVTNTSTLLPSQLAEYTGRPEKYLALHFANNIWKSNTAEVMGHAGTEQKYYDQVVEFAEQIRMIPLQLHKEQPGYILNTLLVPFLFAGETLVARGVSDPETVDKTWMLATGAPMGPMRILDVVGLTTAYNIVSMSPDLSDPESDSAKIAKMLKEKIDAGKTGINAGEGFYKYK